MACNLTQGILKDCRASVGGIRSIFITELDNIFEVSSTGGTVVDVVMYENTQFFRYDFRKQTGSLVETMTSTDAGNIYYAPQVIIQFSGLELNKRNEISLIAKNTALVIIVLDNNGSYWMTGVDNGMSISTGTLQTGQVYGDTNGYNLTFNGGEPEPMLSISESIVNSLLIPSESGIFTQEFTLEFS